jgi:hypothetical protein
MVSCAPALSSLWYNVLTKTKLYTSLRSGLGSRRTRETTGQKKEIQRYSSLSNLGEKSYDVLKDGGSHQSDRPTVDASAVPDAFIPMQDFITKHTTTKQLATKV